MFTLTPNAFAALSAARAENGIPDTYGIRFFGPGPTGPGQESRLSIDFVESPEPDDVVGGGPELRTFVEAAIDERFGDATIDIDTIDGNLDLVLRGTAADDGK
jgi:hypothetical protein